MAAPLADSISALGDVNDEATHEEATRKAQLQADKRRALAEAIERAELEAQELARQVLEAELNETGLYFKGHKIGDIDTELDRIKNFLADEDENRCLGFTDKLQQIEEYLKVINEGVERTKNNLPGTKWTCSSDKLLDANIMCDTQRFWHSRMHDKLHEDPTCGQAPSVLPHSTRLLSDEVLRRIAVQNNPSAGTQTRPNTAPFSNTETPMYEEFVEALTTSARELQEKGEEGDNLVCIEDSAFSHALNNSALIPLWTAPTDCTRGGIDIDPMTRPWYKESAAEQPANTAGDGIELPKPMGVKAIEIELANLAEVFKGRGSQLGNDVTGKKKQMYYRLTKLYGADESMRIGNAAKLSEMSHESRLLAEAQLGAIEGEWLAEKARHNWTQQELPIQEKRVKTKLTSEAGVGSLAGAYASPKTPRRISPFSTPIAPRKPITTTSESSTSSADSVFLRQPVVPPTTTPMEVLTYSDFPGKSTIPKPPKVPMETDLSPPYLLANLEPPTQLEVFDAEQKDKEGRERGLTFKVYRNSDTEAISAANEELGVKGITKQYADRIQEVFEAQIAFRHLFDSFMDETQRAKMYFFELGALSEMLSEFYGLHEAFNLWVTTWKGIYFNAGYNDPTRDEMIAEEEELKKQKGLRERHFRELIKALDDEFMQLPLDLWRISDNRPLFVALDTGEVAEPPPIGTDPGFDRLIQYVPWTTKPGQNLIHWDAKIEAKSQSQIVKLLKDRKNGGLDTRRGRQLKKLLEPFFPDLILDLMDQKQATEKLLRFTGSSALLERRRLRELVEGYESQIEWYYGDWLGGRVDFDSESPVKIGRYRRRSYTRALAQDFQTKHCGELVLPPRKQSNPGYKPSQINEPTDLWRLDWIETLPADLRLRLRGQDRRTEHNLPPANTQKKQPDFSAMAEVRGIKRAALQLLLTTLATNGEQHRPDQRFRQVTLPIKHVSPIRPEVPISLPLEPARRPVEMHPSFYTNTVAKYRRWKQHDYDSAVSYTISERPGKAPPARNFNGPRTIPALSDLQDISQKYLEQLIMRYQLITEAAQDSPRMLVRRLAFLIEQGMRLAQTGEPLPGNDEEPLTVADLETFMQITDESWHEEGQTPYKSPETEAELRERAAFDDFRQDLQQVEKEIPFWSFEGLPAVTSQNAIGYQEPPYKDVAGRISIPPAGSFATLDTVQHLLETYLLTIEDVQIAERAAVSQRSREQIGNYLQMMHDHTEIYFDGPNKIVARVPKQGHPENKYIDGLEKLTPTVGDRVIAPGIRRIAGTGGEPERYEVQYSSSESHKGRPILQENKYTFFEQVAYRIGRDIVQATQSLTRDPAKLTRTEQAQIARDFVRINSHVEKRMRGIPMGDELYAPDISTPNPEDISLVSIARELNKYAPELGRDCPTVSVRNLLDDSPRHAAKREKDANRILSMQIIEESNNAWEERFPENEHVWNFARQRSAANTDGLFAGETRAEEDVPQFFSLRRWPVHCQNAVNQAIIRQSGPVVAKKPQMVEVVPSITAAQRRAEMMNRGKEVRHIAGQPPHFPFGETPYQANYLSWRMEQELKDVEAFYPKPVEEPKISFWRSLPSRINLFREKSSATKKTERDEAWRKRFDLPTVPEHWHPTSISIAAKTEAAIQKALLDPNMPNDLTYYYKPEEIDRMNRARYANQVAERQALISAADPAQREFYKIPLGVRDALVQELVAKGFQYSDGTPFAKEEPREPRLMSRLYREGALGKRNRYETEIPERRVRQRRGVHGY